MQWRSRRCGRCRASRSCWPRGRPARTARHPRQVSSRGAAREMCLLDGRTSAWSVARTAGRCRPGLRCRRRRPGTVPDLIPDPFSEPSLRRCTPAPDERLRFGQHLQPMSWHDTWAHSVPRRVQPSLTQHRTRRGLGQQHRPGTIRCELSSRPQALAPNLNPDDRELRNHRCNREPHHTSLRRPHDTRRQPSHTVVVGRGQTGAFQLGRLRAGRPGEPNTPPSIENDAVNRGEPSSAPAILGQMKEIAAWTSATQS